MGKPIELTVGPCPTCGGSGKWWPYDTPLGTSEVCPTCSGTGRVVGVPTMKHWEALEALWPGEDTSQHCMITRSDEITILVRACERGPAAAVLALLFPEEAPGGKG